MGTKKTSTTVTLVTSKNLRTNVKAPSPVTTSGVSDTKRPQKYFTKEEHGEFLDLIDKKISLAESEVRGALSASVGNKTPRNLEPNSEIEIKIITELLGSRFMKYLKSLRQARLRVLNKTFGMCYACPKPHLIDKARLRSVPNTTSCVKAKEERDKREGKGSAYVYLQSPATA